MSSNRDFFKDKDLRRNMKHEHYGYLFHCKHCGFKDDILVGAGMLFPIIYDEIVEKIKSGFYGEKWQTLFTTNKKTIVDGTLSFYTCSSCGHYASEYNLGLYVLKDGLIDEEIQRAGQDPQVEEMKYVYLYSMLWPIQYYRKIGSYVHRCPSCNKRMHVGGYKDKPVCPKCGKHGNIEKSSIIWD